MKFILLKYTFSLLGGVLGAIGGYLYYLHYSCTNGSCMISSSPIISTLYGSMMGILLFNSFTENKNEK
ncbi:MAG: DUF6132 family protein [Cytophagaceae bacterium]